MHSYGLFRILFRAFIYAVMGLSAYVIIQTSLTILAANRALLHRRVDAAKIASLGDVRGASLGDVRGASLGDVRAPHTATRMVEVKPDLGGSMPAKKRPVSRTVLPFCEGLYSGDPRVLQLAEDYMQKHAKIEFQDKDYVNMTNTCDIFIRTRGYIVEPVSEEERNFPIAYSIVAYQSAEQVERLLRSIYMPQNIYCIHFDAKSSTAFKTAIQTIAACFHNVFVASKIVSVYWGTMSVLEAEMNCLRDLWSRNWKYFINLTGQEMPLYSNRELVRILTAYDGANDLEGTVERRNKERFEYVHDNNRITSRRKSPPPHGVTITKGSIHMIASRGFIDFALHDQRAIDLYTWLADTGVPDEAFFSTLNHNSHLQAHGSYTGIPETHPVLKPFLARFKNWISGPFHAGECHGKWVRDVCVLGVGDLHKLPTRKELFLNKLHINFQHLALDCVEERQLNRTLASYGQNFTFDASYYEQLSFVKNKNN